jgi:hypothetical protein
MEMSDRPFTADVDSRIAQLDRELAEARCRLEVVRQLLRENCGGDEPFWHGIEAARMAAIMEGKHGS